MLPATPAYGQTRGRALWRCGWGRAAFGMGAGATRPGLALLGRRFYLRMGIKAALSRPLAAYTVHRYRQWQARPAATQLRLLRRWWG